MRLIARGRRAQRWVRRSAVLLLVLCALGIVGWLLWLNAHDLDAADKRSSVVAAIIAVVGAAAGAVGWLNRGRREVDSEAELLRTLWDVGHGQWQDEAESRQLSDPRPVRLRWIRSERGVATDPALGGAEPVDLAGELAPIRSDPKDAAAELVETYFDRGLRQLVISGSPGAGKTSIAILFTLSALTRFHDRSVVPVLLSMSAWRPGLQMQEWIAHRIREEYLSTVDTELVTSLLGKGVIIPVLDGFDEIAKGFRQEAAAELTTAAGRGMRSLLTTRLFEFQDAVKASPLPHADVVEVLPIDVEDALLFLRQHEPEGSQRWDEVGTDMAADPKGPLARALLNPLMLSLTRLVFKGSTEPPAILRSMSESQIRDLVLDRFAPTVYGNTRRSARAQRQLAFLMHSLKEADRRRDPNLLWWNLPHALPQWLGTPFVMFVVTVLGAANGWLFQHLLLPDAGPRPAVLVGLVVGVAVGSVLLLREPGNGEHSSALGALRTVGRSAVIGVAVFSFGLGCMLVIGRAAGWADVVNMFGFVDAVATVPYGALKLAVYSLIVNCLSLCAALVTNALSRAQPHVPRRARPLFGTLFESLAPGIVAVVPFALLAGIPVLLSLSDDFDPTPVLTMFSAAAVLTMVTVTLTGWLNRPEEAKRLVSPRTVLRDDRTAVLTSATMSGIAVAAATWMVIAPAAADAQATAVLSAAAGVSFAIVTAVGSRSAWLPFVGARIWFGLLGFTPVFLMRFLDDAHRRGVLRQAGPAYQLRHDLLTKPLSQHWSPGENDRGLRRFLLSRPATVAPKHRPWRRRTAIAALVVGLVAAPVAAVVVQPSVQSSAQTESVRPLGETAPSAGPAGDPVPPAVSPDGAAMAVTNGARTTVDLWGTSDHRRHARLMPVATVRRTAFSKDSRRLTTVARSPERPQEQHTEIWDVVTGARLAGLVGEVGINDAVFSRDQHTMAFLDDTATPHLWDNAGGRYLGRLAVDDEPAERVELDPTGKFGAVVFANGRVDVWSAGPVRRIDSIHTLGAVLAVAFNADGGQLAVADNTGRTLIRDTSGVHVVLTHELGFALAFSPDGGRLAVGTYSGFVRVVNTGTGTVELTLDRHAAAVLAIEYGADGSTLVSAAADGSARTWDAHSGAPRVELAALLLDVVTNHEANRAHAPMRVAVSPDGSRIAIIENRRHLRLLDARTGVMTRVLDSRAKQIRFDRSGTALWETNPDGSRSVRSVVAGGPAQPIANPVSAVSVGLDGRALVIRLAGGTTEIVDPQSAQVRSSWNSGPTVGEIPPGCAVFVYAEAAGGLALRDLETGEPGPLLPAVRLAPRRLWCVDSGRRLAMAGADGWLQMWDTATGRLLLDLQGPVTAVQTSADGTRIAAIDADRVAKVWDVNEGGLRTTVRGLPDAFGIGFGVTLIAVHPRSELVLTANSDRHIRRWDDHGQPMHTYPDTISAAALLILPDGRAFVTFDGDGWPSFWDVG
jgi:WD40 repeat protein